MSPETRTGQVRIIGGKWRHRRVSFPDVETLRPTPDRIRETLFNWLQPVIDGARCLDLFAGSGVLGIEALSRGAARVVMVEHRPRITSHLRGQLQRLGIAGDEACVVDADALSYLRGPAQRFDIVFVDAPFHTPLLAASCRLLAQGAWLAPHALIYLECAADGDPPALPVGWEVIRHKQAGQVEYYLSTPA